MLNAPPYFAVVALVAVLAGLAGLEQLCRQLGCRRSRSQHSVIRTTVLVAQALLRPAAKAVFAVTGIWLVTMLVTSVVQMRGPAGAVAQPVAVGLAAGLVLMTVPRYSVSIGGIGAASPTNHQALELSRSDHEDFRRWEAELRIGPRSTGAGDTLDPLQ